MEFTETNIGLKLETELLIKQSNEGACGVDLPEVADFAVRTGQNSKREEIGLAQVTEPQVIRHFVRLSNQNFSIDAGFYPLGSCTMKHNPRLNEKMARLPGLGNIHPLQDQSTVQGALELMYNLQHWLGTLTGLTGVSLAPAAGAQGELAGMLVIKKALAKKGLKREIVLIPDSAHGTNPATAAMCGFKIKEIPSNKEGLVDLEAFEALVAEHKDNLAAIMITNPNTCGKFEKNIVKIADLVHQNGGYFYCDGANYNAIVGKVRPADIGVDVMHFNLHKTFSTPHGGGGPGSGPIAVREELTEFLPDPHVVKEGDSFTFKTYEDSVGKVKGFHGQFGMHIRALTYMLSHGADGLQKVAEDAVLSANYVLHELKGDYNLAFEGSCMHECLFNDKLQKADGVTTLDIAKALVEYGVHPMTVFFPLVTPGAMLIEPTETESKATIDDFIAKMKYIAKEVREGRGERYHEYPVSTPRRRLDEVKAAKNPILTWVEQAAQEEV